LIGPKHQDIRCLAYVGDHVPGGAGECEDRVILTEDVGVFWARASYRPDNGSVVRLEDDDESCDTAFHLFLIDDIGALETGLRPGVGCVLDLHCERWACQE
jgi:hypothetical protein